MLKATLGIIVAVVLALLAAGTVRAQLPPVPTAVPTVVPLPTVTPPPLPPVPTVPSVPPVPTPPSAPSVPAPSVPTPGGGGGSGGSGGGSGGSTTSGGSGGGSAGSQPSSGGGGGSSSGGNSSSSASGGGGSSSGRSATRSTDARAGGRTARGSGARGSRRSREERRHHAAAQRDRRLRRLVLALPACVQRLSSLQRRVLVQRAGVGAGAPRSRRSVARRLDLSVRRVTRVEHAGLRRLRTLERSDSCGSTVVAPSALTRGTFGAGTVATAGLARRGGGGGDGSDGGKSGGGGGSGGGSDDNGGGQQGIGGDFATSHPADGGSPGSAAAWLPILLAALAALSAGYLAVGGVRSLRMRRQ
jgi:hypothetical protein